MKKFMAAFPVCALMALTLCAAPASALANETTDLAMSEERIELDAESFESTEGQCELVEEGLEFEEEQVEEVVVQDDQLIAEEETGDESTMLGEGDMAASSQSNTKKRIDNCELKGGVRTHKQGEDLDLSGLYWLVTYKDGSTAQVDVDPNATSGYDKNQVGWQHVSINQEMDDWHWFGIFTVIVNRVVNPRLDCGNGVSVEPSANARKAQQLDRSALVAKHDDGLPIDKNLDERYEVQTQPEVTVSSAQRLSIAFGGIVAVQGIEKDGSPLGQKLGNDFVQSVSGGARLYAYPINGAGYEALVSAS